MLLQNQLRTLRRKKGWTQEQLARKVGVSRQSIIAIEKGKYKPTVELALKLAKALECPVEEIFWLQESKGGEQ